MSLLVLVLLLVLLVSSLGVVLEERVNTALRSAHVAAAILQAKKYLDARKAPTQQRSSRSLPPASSIKEQPWEICTSPIRFTTS